MSIRKQVIAELADLICAVGRSHPVRVAIDGVDAAGKTALADELAPRIEGRGRPVIRTSVDGFHNPREVRYQRGVESPEGYYWDSFNYDNLRRELLIPLGPGGNRKYRRVVFNCQEDAPSLEPSQESPLNAILLLDGIFLLRPEIIQYWDFSIFLDVDFDVSVPRAVDRAVARSGGESTPQNTTTQYNLRYIPGQKIYLAEINPKEKADVIMKNNDLANPKLFFP